MPTDQLNKFINANVSWTHYVFLMRLKDENERRFYEIETAANRWNIEELKRQFELILPSKEDFIKILSNISDDTQ